MIEMQPEHIRAFETAQMRSFEDRAIAHARKTLPLETESLDDGQLRSRFQREIVKSQSYGLKSERQILCFLDAGLMLGEGFDRAPNRGWVRELLLDSQRHPEERARTLAKRAAIESGYKVVG
jgi:hypothetical protein